MNLWALGTGESLNIYAKYIKDLNHHNTLAFQKCFPYCYKYFGLVPKFWFNADPNSALDGLKFLQETTEKEKFKSMKIFVPHFAYDTYAYFRMYCGTTPLGSLPTGWDNYINNLKLVEKMGYNIERFDCTTTKYSALVESAPENAERFTYKKPIFGTVPYDSDCVDGTRFKWGLESKLTSAVFPLAHMLQARKLFIMGFDMVGNRFFEGQSGDARHPWADETQAKSQHAFPLSIIKKWVSWKNYHNIEFYNVVEDSHTLLNAVVPYVKIEEALNV